MFVSSSQISENYQKCLYQIGEAEHRSGRLPGSTKLVVVTKGQPADKIRQAIDAGARILGENYPEETDKKIDQIHLSDIEWHMIGHIQARKIRYLVDHFSAIHSIDSMETAMRLEKKFSEAGKTIQVLYEINVSGEASKQGFRAADEKQWTGIIELFQKLIKFSHIKCTGLMTMPPISENPEDSRGYFQRLWKLSEILKREIGEGYFQDLSMGTSFDYEIAIEEGATFVRVGEAIMGPRVYKIRQEYNK